jgi:hypothetical protein
MAHDPHTCQVQDDGRYHALQRHKSKRTPPQANERLAPPADTTSHPHRHKNKPSKARSDYSSGRTAARQHQHSADGCEAAGRKAEPAAWARAKREVLTRGLLHGQKPTESSATAPTMNEVFVTAPVPAAVTRSRERAGQGFGQGGQSSPEKSEKMYPHANADGYALFLASRRRHLHPPQPHNGGHRKGTPGELRAHPQRTGPPGARRGCPVL